MAGIEGRDISGCATSELAAFFHRNKPEGMDSRTWVKARIPEWAVEGDDGRDFAKIVDQQKYPFTGLRFVDRIVHALGLNLNTLTERGELTIIPSGDRGAALKMVKEEIAASMEPEIDMCDLTEEELAVRVKERMQEMGEEEIQARVARLQRLRETHCARSPEQCALLERDAQRTSERRQRAKKEATQAA